jgi:carbon starvation protein
MSLPLLAALVLAALVLGYTLYGRFIARQLALDDAATTPAAERGDDVDFVPTRPFYLLGQHFSAIAAAGPIVGPIAACLVWGWVPCVLWIALGVVFVGAVHDFASLVASVRHGAGSIAEIARRHLGRRAWIALTTFIWLSLVYVIVAFTDVTAATFLGKVEELPGRTRFHKGGAVAAAATAYLLLAAAMGVVQRRWRLRTSVLTAVFVPATLACVWLGTVPAVSMLFATDASSTTTWHVVILAYCFVASLLPVSWLLQPRGYLGGFVLYLALAVGTVGVFFGGRTEILQPAFSPGDAALGRALFPFLFVTIACGACSGFHGLVCGGTTSKQIAREPHCRPVGYGAMLLEAFVALIALATVLVLSPAATAGRAPGAIYGDGIAAFLVGIVGPEWATFAAVFGSMAFSTFVFDTLDVATRLGRYLLQELVGAKGAVAGMLATLAMVGVPLAILLLAGGTRLRTDFWNLFGAANQLLAGLTLLACTVWLRRTGRRSWWAFAPACVVMAITTVALGWHAVEGARSLAAEGFSTKAVNGLVAVALLALATSFLFEARLAVRRGPAEAAGTGA